MNSNSNSNSNSTSSCNSNRSRNSNSNSNSPIAAIFRRRNPSGRTLWEGSARADIYIYIYIYIYIGRTLWEGSARAAGWRPAQSLIIICSICLFLSLLLLSLSLHVSLSLSLSLYNIYIYIYIYGPSCHLTRAPCNKHPVHLTVIVCLLLVRITLCSDLLFRWLPVSVNSRGPILSSMAYPFLRKPYVQIARTIVGNIVPTWLRRHMARPIRIVRVCRTSSPCRQLPGKDAVMHA